MMTMEIVKFGVDAENYLKNSNAFINIADGSVRSGKTVATIFRFLTAISESKHTTHMIAGKSWTSVVRNVINPLVEIMEQFGIKYNFKRADQELQIEDNQVYIAGLNNEASADIIAGLTLSKVFLDEASRVPESSFQMLVSRLSLDDSQIFITTNPDSPYHYLFTNYIDNEKLKTEGVVKHFKFILDNNPALPDSYIKQIKLSYEHSDVFYRRNILGEWCIASGRIFDSFDEDKHVIDSVPDGLNTIIIGTDYGLSAPTAFVAVARKFNRGPFYVLDTDYHDPSITGIQKSDREKSRDLKRFCDRLKIKKYNSRSMYVPHDAGSLKAEINKFGNFPFTARTHKPDTLKSIYELQTLFDKDQILIINNKNNEQLIKDINNYSWDLKKSEKGIDAPLMVNDHSIDAMRLGILGSRRQNPVII